MPTGAELFVESLEKLGIQEIFTLVGDHLNEVLSVAWRRGFHILDMRHESGVTHAADAFARVRRRPAVSLVTGGPGHTNSLTGVATASLVGSPLIAVSGAAALAMAGRQVFQVIDQVGMAAPVVKFAAQATQAAQIPYLLGRAWAEATAGRMGPVHLSIPVDVFSAGTEAPLPMPLPQARPECAPAMRDAARALDLLKNAERPIVIAGSGLWWADAGAELEEFLRRTQLPYYSITLARGVIRDDSPYSMGYADPALNKSVQKAFLEADVILVLGKRLDSRLALGGPRLFSPAAKFIQVDIHPQELGNTRRLELGICADLKTSLRALVELLGDTQWPLREAWWRRLRELDAEWRSEVASLAVDSASPLNPVAFFAELKKHLPDVLYSWDGGDFVHWGRVVLPALRSGGWLRLGPMATIGAGLPNSVGLQVANPNDRVVMITGDGSLGFYIGELDTLVRHNLPVVLVVGNDAAWGVERELQHATQGTTVACDLRQTRYDLVMQGFGGEGELIERLDQVGPALARAFASGKPYLLNVLIRGLRSPFTEWAISRKKQ
jgi:acetolactate synthase-1/2/3 large subunit